MKSPWFVTALSSALVSLAMHTSAATPTLDEVLKAKRDLWGEAAMAEPNGPSYEFFEKLLPPPRYVNADFGYYPIVLSAPGAKVKARLIANGMGLNLRGGGRQWRDNGTPVLFRVGPDELSFGKFQQKLQEPVLAEGHLPIVSIRYLHQTPILAEGMVPLTQERVDRVSEVYELEAFASTEPALAEKGMVFVKFALAEGTTGMITVQVDSGNALELEDGKVTDSAGQVLAYLDSHWAKSLDNNGKWRQPFVQAKLTPGKVVTIAIPTRPLESNFALRDGDYDTQRALCAGAWKKILSKATRVETPEQIVNDAWRHLLIQNFELINNNRMHYSHGNQYDALYEGEGSDAAMALMVWGYEETMRELMGPLFEFTRKGLEFHQAGFKLNNICRYYWQTRDSSVFDEYRASWQREAERLDKNRTGEHGLFPPEQYCGDIHTKVQSLNPNSKAWRAMRDLGAALDDIGETKLAAHYSSVAKDFRQTVLTAIQKSVNHTTTPPFVPIALYTNEPAHSPICDVRIGSYWNIIIGYTLSSGIFPVGGPEENWIPHYQEQHGGLCMGMLRSGGMSNTWWNTEYKLNPLYGTRYALDALRRDEPERALVAFYGMLAQGFTRNTFVCGEGAALVPLDPYGRLLSLPPNSAANAHFLSMLRHLLIQECDLNDDGKPETLRLGFATPQRWLMDGKGYSIENAPTAFGRLSARVSARLERNEVFAELDLPQRNPPEKTWFRVRVPNGWQVKSGKCGGKSFKCDNQGTFDLSGLAGKQTLEVHVTRKK